MSELSYYRKNKEEGIMVVKKKNESYTDLMKRFKKKYSKSGLNKEIRDRMYYDKPSIKKRKKRAAAQRMRQREEEKHLKRLFRQTKGMEGKR